MWFRRNSVFKELNNKELHRKIITVKLQSTNSITMFMAIWYTLGIRLSLKLTYEWFQDYASVPVLQAAQQHRTGNRWCQKNPLWWCKGVVHHSWHMSIQSLKHIIKENTSSSHLLLSYKRETYSEQADTGVLYSEPTWF
jgi:hypothetical protein